MTLLNEQVRENNWRELGVCLVTAPISVLERASDKLDFAALKTSKKEFLKLANSWPSYLGKEHDEYVESPVGASQNVDGITPFGYTGIRGFPSYCPIKFPEFKNDEEMGIFAKYVHLVHTYKSSVDSSRLVYETQEASSKAVINAALLLSMVHKKNGSCNFMYTQSDNTPMSEIYGLLGKKIDGTDMTTKEQIQWFQEVSDDYVNQIKGVPSKFRNDQKYGEFKKEHREPSLREQYDAAKTPKEKDMIWKKIMSSQNKH